MFKKTLSILLSLALAASCFAGTLTAFADETETGTLTVVDTNKDGVGEVSGNSNIEFKQNKDAAKASDLLGLDASTIITPGEKANGNKVVFSAKSYNPTTGVETEFTSFGNQAVPQRTYDDSFTDSAELQIFNDMVKTDSASGKLVFNDGAYVEFIYDLGAVYTINGFALGAAALHRTIPTYSISTAENFSQFFSGSTTKLVDFDVTNLSETEVQPFARTGYKIAADTVNARFVIFRVRRSNPQKEANADAPHIFTTIRASEISVFGEYLRASDSNDFDVNLTAKVNDDNNGTKYNAAVDISRNLIANKNPYLEKYFDSEKMEAPTVFRHYEDGYTLNKVTNTTKAANQNIFFGNGGLINFAELDETPNENNRYKVLGIVDDESKKYLDVVYKLDGVANIGSFAMLMHASNSLRAGHYKVSFANDADSLFGEGSTTFDYANNTYNFVSHSYKDQNIKAQYVGIRFICGINSSAIGEYFDATQAYVRVNHFDVFGTYETAADSNVTVNAPEGVTVTKGDVVGVKDWNGAYAAGAATVDLSVDKTSYEADGKTYDFAGWYAGENKLSADAEYTYTLAAANEAITAKYEANAVTYTVTFTDKVGNTIAAVTANEGDTLANVIAANSITAPAIYGYTFKGWNVDTAQAVTDNITVQATYEKNTETKYTVTVTDTAGNVTTSENLVFDQKIVLTDAEGKTAAWEVDGKVVGYGTSVTLYVCGNMNVKAIAEATEADAVVNLGVVAEGGSFTVFGRVVSTKNISKVGVIFASKTAYNGGLKDSTDWLTDVKNLPDNYYKMTEIANPTAGDFMSTLTNVKTGATRYAVSYAVLEDGTVLYGDVAEKTF